MVIAIKGLRNKETTYFQFRFKSSDFRLGWGKPSKEHFTQVKAAWTVSVQFRCPGEC